MNLKIPIPFILTVKQLRFNLKPPFLKKELKMFFSFLVGYSVDPLKVFAIIADLC